MRLLNIPLLVVLVLGPVHARADGDGVLAENHAVSQNTVASIMADSCINTCGDVNGSGTVTSADYVQFRKYNLYALLYGSYDCSEMDGHQSLDIRDVIWLIHYVFYQGPAPRCPADLPAHVVQPSEDYWVRVSDVVPAGASRVTLYPEFRSLAPSASISADLKIDVEGITPDIDSVSWIWGPVGPWQTYLVDEPWDNDTSGIVMINTHWYPNDSSVAPGTYHLGYFDIVVPPVSYARRITYTLVGYPEGDNAPMMLDTALVGWELHLETYSVRMTGDSNNDGVLTASDAIVLVNYVFKSGPSPHPVPATGDCNCSGSVTSADILVVVNHVFKGGAPPCDVEAECTIDLENWTCP